MGRPTAECAYCGYEVEVDKVDYQGICLDPIPDVHDDEGWEALGMQHAEDCEWITTRAAYQRTSTREGADARGKGDRAC